jgi:hypothetical protein
MLGAPLRAQKLSLPPNMPLSKLLWGFTILLAAGWHMARADGQPGTIEGYVLDSACAFTKNPKKPAICVSFVQKSPTSRRTFCPSFLCFHTHSGFEGAKKEFFFLVFRSNAAG